MPAAADILSSAFEKLHPQVQHWLYQQNWDALRDIQEAAITPILAAKNDVLISAATAAGKTEAAFLPACSYLAQKQPRGIGMLYISPLKALINDLQRRLESLCQKIDMPLTPWHGDVALSLKQKQFKQPCGILLITPESLEALLLKRKSWCHDAFAQLCYVIIDEFHSFIGTERGQQLLSLLHRVEFLIEREVPRIGLSATLGELHKVAELLRPNPTHKGALDAAKRNDGQRRKKCHIIESQNLRSDLKIQMCGYLERQRDEDDLPLNANQQIISDLYLLLRGKSHLIFAGSREKTEWIASGLQELCARDHVPNEFFPHHGNLAKDLRESLEARMQNETLPTSAICTTTLELGIDIGSVHSIAQIGAPHSVASLRQRLGRSGRRGEPAILRLFVAESELKKNSHIQDLLRLRSVQCAAMINLLLQKWYEPPEAIAPYYFSTLVQQTLSVIGQYGGVLAAQLWQLLCKTGPFRRVNQSLYATLLRTLAAHDLITQTKDGQLIVGSKGEKLLGHYSFYSAFQTPDEYRLEHKGKILGSIPVLKPIQVGDFIIFAAQKWEIVAIHNEKKLIALQSAKGGNAPKFTGDGSLLHDAVRQEMKRIYRERSLPRYLDDMSRSLLEEGFDYFANFKLHKSYCIELGPHLHLLPWRGDRIHNALTILLRMQGLNASNYDGVIDLKSIDKAQFQKVAQQILASPKPTPIELGEQAANTAHRKT